MKGRIWLLILFAFAACSKEEITARAYPRVLTDGISNLTSTSVEFSGEIIFTSVDIVEYGFVWSSSTFPMYETSNRVPLGSRSTTGTFHGTATGTFQSGVDYSVRAYAKTEKYLVYGGTVDFYYHP